MQDVTLGDNDGIVKYGDLPIPYTIYMDDCNNLAEDIESARSKNKRIEEMLDSKLLDVNSDKSNFMIIGAKKSRT